MSLRFLRAFNMRIVIFLIILFLPTVSSFGQNLIGYKTMEIRNYMKENRKDLNFNTVRNDLYSYLKYTDASDTQTILFFLAPDSVCTSVRVIFASGLKDEKMKELDSNYKRIDKENWICSTGGKNYLVKLKEEKWTCTITYESEK
jgi:hypothetical protein